MLDPNIQVSCVMNDYLFCFQVEESDRRVREEEKKRQRDLELKRQREEEVSYGHFCTLAQFHYVIITLLKWSVYSIQCIVHVCIPRLSLQ